MEKKTLTLAHPVFRIDISSYLRDKFPKDGDDLYGDADPGMRDWLNDKFRE